MCVLEMGTGRPGRWPAGGRPAPAGHRPARPSSHRPPAGRRPGIFGTAVVFYHNQLKIMNFYTVAQNLGALQYEKSVEHKPFDLKTVFNTP